MKKANLSIGWKYVVITYIVFGVMVLGICGTASMVFHASPMVMRVLSNVCAWSPTIVLFAGFKYWCGDMSIGNFFRRAFAGRVKPVLLVGLVWTFWHGILWMVDSDYTSGIEAAIYILSNVVVITAMHMIIAVILEKEDNLIYALIVHFFFNLPYCFLIADITFYVIIMPLYVLVAGIFLYVRYCEYTTAKTGN